ncbi:NUDIX family hydrolase [Myxococcus stipitatus DSM 14675]|uniref:NUDIX family hydrolase n=1 Tax=Myxococcus stipitatus (strain DSM 14675 / JCM 12634 / Mx s8) TaxID=1278073 RepID=L7UK66_MYXSD|nr:CoA pyrophosphatase [Myxococcus stipitatus]AGC48398.1 NUDIX family hydrolase [Myxococcus stipitatus DSM 14675]
MSVEALFQGVESRLASRPARDVNLPGLVLREAAVLVPLFERDGVPHMVFTRRPATLRTHANQYSYPGGGRDAEDLTPLHTALRETEEELGIDRRGVRVLGMLDEVPTISQYRVRPFVGVIPGDGQYTPSVEEVAFILEVPLERLMDPAILRVERKEVLGAERDLYFYTYEGHVIWGATARILRDFLAQVEQVPGLRALLTPPR